MRGNGRDGGRDGVQRWMGVGCQRSDHHHHSSCSPLPSSCLLPAFSMGLFFSSLLSHPQLSTPRLSRLTYLSLSSLSHIALYPSPYPHPRPSTTTPVSPLVSRSALASHTHTILSTHLPLYPPLAR
jgi:hypothetical protein